MPTSAVSSVEDLPKNPAVSVTTATLELELQEDTKTKLAAFQWRKKSLEEADVEAVIFLSHGYAGLQFNRRFFVPESVSEPIPNHVVSFETCLKICMHTYCPSNEVVPELFLNMHPE